MTPRLETRSKTSKTQPLNFSRPRRPIWYVYSSHQNLKFQRVLVILHNFEITHFQSSGRCGFRKCPSQRLRVSLLQTLLTTGQTNDFLNTHLTTEMGSLFHQEIEHGKMMKLKLPNLKSKFECLIHLVCHVLPRRSKLQLTSPTFSLSPKRFYNTLFPTKMLFGIKEVPRKSDSMSGGKGKETLKSAAEVPVSVFTTF